MPLALQGFSPHTYFEDIENLTVKDITFHDSATDAAYAGCRSVIVDGIGFRTTTRGANNDGIDPDCGGTWSSPNCTIDTGSDAIVVKTTKAMAALYGPCENITISNCCCTRGIPRSRSARRPTGHPHSVFTGCVARDCSRILGIWMRDGAHREHPVSNIIGFDPPLRDAHRYPDHWWARASRSSSAHLSREPDGSYNDAAHNFNPRRDAVCESSAFIRSAGKLPDSERSAEHVALALLKRQGTHRPGCSPNTPAGAKHDAREPKPM
jgi:hypothetical protein